MSFKKELLNALENDPLFRLRLINEIGADVISNSSISIYAEMDDINLEEGDFQVEFKEMSEDEMKKDIEHSVIQFIHSLFDKLIIELPSKYQNKMTSSRKLFTDILFDKYQKESFITFEEIEDFLNVHFETLKREIWDILREQNNIKLYEALETIKEL